MEKSKHYISKLVLSILLFSIVPDVYSESPYKKTIYNAFVNREMYKWANVIRTIETTSSPVTVEQKLELIKLYYGYTAYLINKKQVSTAELFIEKAEEMISEVIKLSPKNAAAYAFKGSFAGYRIGISKFKAIYLGSESTDNINKALEFDPQNIQAIIDKGNMLYYSPRLLGGDKNEALKFYLKGVRLFEKNADTDHNWLYLNLLTNIAMAYEKTDQPALAKLIYEKILHKEPNYLWVKDDLYPKFLAKNKQ
ncbi:MAG: hypothetical protein WCG93_04380 [Paludibacter sp.]